MNVMSDENTSAQEDDDADEALDEENIVANQQLLDVRKVVEIENYLDY